EEKDSTADSTAAPGAVQPTRPEPGRMPEPAAGAPRSDSAKAAPERRREEGYPLVLRNLESGEERRIEDVVTYMFNDDGSRLIYSRSNKAGDADGVYVMDTRNGNVTTLLSGKAEYKQISVDEAGRQVAFISNLDEFSAKQPSWKLYYWDGRYDDARLIAEPGVAGITEGRWISQNGTIQIVVTVPPLIVST